MMQKIVLAFLCIFSLCAYTGSALAQDSFETTWMMAQFNEGNFCDFFTVTAESVSLQDEYNDWIWEHPQHKAMAYYYFGEACYNCAFDESEARIYFQGARSFFQGALAEDLGDIFFEKQSYFKIAWCSYRLAELCEVQSLEDATLGLDECLGAIDSGDLLDGENVPKDVQCVSRYLYADACLQRALLNKCSIINIRRSLTPSEGDEVRGYFEKAIRWFDVLHDSPSLEQSDYVTDADGFVESVKLMQAFSRIELGKLHLLLGDRAQAQQHFENADTMLGTHERYIAYKAEIDKMEYLYREPGSKAVGDESKSTVTASIDRLQDVDDRSFNRGLIDLSAEAPKTAPFDDLARATGFFGTSRLAQAGYWRGVAQTLLGEDWLQAEGIPFEAHQIFDTFLGSDIPYFETVLAEDARLRKYFDTYLSYTGNNPQQLQQLRKSVEAFRPEYEKLRARRDGLYEMILYDLNLDSASILSNEDLVIEMLRYAATSVGAQSARFIRMANGILQFESMSSVDTNTFYCAVRDKIVIPTLPAEQAMVDKYNSIIASLESSIGNGSVYFDEANYLRAICEYEKQFNMVESKRDYSTAKDLLADIVIRRGNVRALYYLAFTLEALGQSDLAEECCRVVAQKTEEISEATFFYQNAIAWCRSGSSVTELTIDGNTLPIDHFVYPDATLPNGLYVEQFSVKEYLESQKLAEARELLKTYPLPPRSVYLSNNRIEESLFVSRIYDDLNGSIDERKGRVFSGLMISVLPENIDATLYFDGEQIAGNPAREPIEIENIQSGSVHRIVIDATGYYRFTKDHAVVGSPFDKSMRHICLSKEVNYQSKGTADTDIAFTDPLLFGNVILNEGSSDIDDEILEGFDLYSFRDCIVYRNQGYMLVVNSKENLIEKVNLDRPHTRVLFIKNFNGDSFVSPEGIAQDSEGNVYVADWGNHRVVVFSTEGEYACTIGGRRGENTKDDIGKPAKFVFPTRICIEEDKTVQKEFEGMSFYRDTYIYVADRNGIHKLDLMGNYLATVPQKPGIETGDFYGIAVRGYGTGAELLVVNRRADKDQMIKRFVAE